MAQAGASALTAHYRQLQQEWKVTYSETYRRLVVPNGNGSMPFHRWFHLKEAYSSQLFAQLVADSGFKAKDALRVYDPYSGSGTTLLSALDFSADRNILCDVVGIERNPFLWELSNAKVLGRISGQDAAGSFKGALKSVEKTFYDTRKLPIQIPMQSTLQNEQYFSRENVKDLIGIRLAIDACAEGLTRSLLRVCVAASVEACGRLRRDGRALRFAPNRQPKTAWNAFSERAAAVLQDLEVSEPFKGSGTVVLGDGREGIRESGKYDWIVFSPPYPNNIDYTEVYKTEAWVLGCYESSDDMRAQRQLTVRSHPSIRFNREYSYLNSDASDRVTSILEPIISAVPHDKYRSGRVEVVKGYADDMLLTLKSGRESIAPKGQLAFIVGNSAHGIGDEAFVIAADVVMGALAELVGWRVTELRVARELIRRNADSEFLRESVVVLEPA